MDSETMKRAAARRAVELVEPGMKVGLGTGSTAAHVVALLGERVASGLRIVCVPTSEATAALARAAGLALTTLDAEPILDLTIDGADEIDPSLNLIKGGGGALLREKIVACSSDRLIVVADVSKRVARLGAFPLPVEITPFGALSTRMMVEALASDIGCTGPVTVRAHGGQPFVTDNGNLVLDCAFGAIADPEALDDVLRGIPGVVETGLFIGIAEVAILGLPSGSVEELRPVEDEEAYDLAEIDDDQGERPS
jgi:ribose 5-phosphate isomerase A